MQKITVHFVAEKPTPRTIRYKEDAPEGLEQVGYIYIPKKTLGSDPPVAITVTVEERRG